VGFEVQYIKGEVDSLSKELRGVAENVGIIHDMLVRETGEINPAPTMPLAS
jgi:hypothetical protein